MNDTRRERRNKREKRKGKRGIKEAKRGKQWEYYCLEKSENEAKKEKREEDSGGDKTQGNYTRERCNRLKVVPDVHIQLVLFVSVHMEALQSITGIALQDESDCTKTMNLPRPPIQLHF